MEKDLPSEQQKTSTVRRLFSWILLNQPRLIFENKIGVSEIIAVSALLISILAVFMSIHVLNKPQKPNILDLRPALPLIVQLEKIDNQVPPHIEIKNEGPVNATQVQIEFFLHRYYPDWNDPEKVFISSPAADLEWSIDKLSPSEIITFDVNESSLDAFLPGITDTKKHNRMMEIHLTYRREVDSKKYSQRVLYFLSPEGKWETESSDWDQAALKTLRMKLDMADKVLEFMEKQNGFPAECNEPPEEPP